MVKGRPKTPLLQTDGEQGFVFCDSDGNKKKMIAAKLDMIASKSTTSRRPANRKLPSGLVPSFPIPTLLESDFNL